LISKNAQMISTAHLLPQARPRSRSRETRRPAPTPRTPHGTRCQTARCRLADAPPARCHCLRASRRPCRCCCRGSQWRARPRGTSRTGRCAASWSSRSTLATSRLAPPGLASALAELDSREGAKHLLVLHAAALCLLSCPRLRRLRPRCCCLCQLGHTRQQHRTQGGHRVGRGLRTCGKSKPRLRTMLG